MGGKFRFFLVSILAVGLLTGVAFGLGVKYGHGNAPKSSGGLTAQQVLSLVGGAAAPQGGTGAAPTGSPPTGSTSGPASALANLTTGKVTAVQGQTVTVEIRPGTTTKVNLGSSITVNKYASGAASDVKEGSSVLVQGARGSDGTVNATSIALLPSDLATLLGNLTSGFAAGGAPSGIPGTPPSVGATPASGNAPPPTGR